MNSELTQSVQGSQNVHCSAAAKQVTARSLRAGSSGGHAEGSLGACGQGEERAWGRGGTVLMAVSPLQEGEEKAHPAVFASIVVCFPPCVCLSLSVPISPTVVALGLFLCFSCSSLSQNGSITPSSRHNSLSTQGAFEKDRDRHFQESHTPDPAKPQSQITDILTPLVLPLLPASFPRALPLLLGAAVLSCRVPVGAWTPWPHPGDRFPWPELRLRFLHFEPAPQVLS